MFRKAKTGGRCLAIGTGRAGYSFSGRGLALAGRAGRGLVDSIAGRGGAVLRAVKRGGRVSSCGNGGRFLSCGIAGRGCFLSCGITGRGGRSFILWQRRGGLLSCGTTAGGAVGIVRSLFWKYESHPNC
ncbi:MAG TPA: hypothetical protein V6D21_23140 [Candidatus Obscuribacterales bacterium]